MKISQKRPPLIPEPSIQRAFQHLYDDLNELIDAVNKGNTSHKRTSNIGKSGDIRVRKDSDANYLLELKTDEGWVVSTNTTTTGFKFQDKSEEDISLGK